MLTYKECAIIIPILLMRTLRFRDEITHPYLQSESQYSNPGLFSLEQNSSLPYLLEFRMKLP